MILLRLIIDIRVLALKYSIFRHQNSLINLATLTKKFKANASNFKSICCIYNHFQKGIFSDRNMKVDYTTLV